MIIGLGGEAGSGKSTVAGILTRELGMKELSFAANLKMMCMHVFDLVPDQVYTQEGKELNFKVPRVLGYREAELLNTWILQIGKHVPSVMALGTFQGRMVECFRDKCPNGFSNPREILQFVGTEICRNIYDKNYHINIVDQKVCSLEDSIVISDARFENERAYVSSKQGKNILVIDPTQTKQASVGIKGHESETSLGKEEDYDFVIFNNKSEGLESLRQKILTMLK